LFSFLLSFLFFPCFLFFRIASHSYCHAAAYAGSGTGCFFLVLLKPSLQPRASVECARLRHQGHAAVLDAVHNLGVISIQIFGRLPNAPDQLVRNKPGDLPNGLPDARPPEELEIF
jgi:hypothetical protein